MRGFCALLSNELIFSRIKGNYNKAGWVVQLSRYFVAKLVRRRTWFVSGCVRNLGHVALERSLSPAEDLFEFFVAENYVSVFISLLVELQARGDVISFAERPNRFHIL